MESQPFQPLIIYKNKVEITNSRELPVAHEFRICTDLFCTIITTLFAIAMLITAIIFFDLDKLAQTTYPTDIDGRLCTRDNPKYNYLYFTSPRDTNKRLCVESCPKGTQSKLNCWPTNELSCHENSNPEFEVMIYPSVETDTSMGLFCMPEDEDLKSKILKSSHMEQKFLFVAASRSIVYSALCSIGLGVVFLLLTAFIPGAMTYLSIGLGGVSCIAIGVLLLVLDPESSQLLQVYHILKIIFSAVIIIVGIIALLSLVIHSGDIQLCVKYLKFAGQSMAQFLPALIPTILLFYLLVVGLVALMTFQMLGYWSLGEVTFLPDHVHKTLGGTLETVMVVVCAFEFFWGLAFLKEAFDFLVSGMTVFYYFKNVPFFPFALGNLVKFHWGSVVAGSFLLNFFYIFDMFYDFLKPKSLTSQSVFTKVCCCCDRILGFSRSDTLSFVNLVGQPYCNSSRYCEQIDEKSMYFEGSQSVFRFFRIGAHVLLASIGTVLTYVFMSSAHHLISIPALIVSFIINLFIVTFFVCLIAEMAEAILLCDLTEKYLKNEDQVASHIHRGPYSKITRNPGVNDSGFEGYQMHYTTE